MPTVSGFPDIMISIYLGTVHFATCLQLARKTTQQKNVTRRPRTGTTPLKSATLSLAVATR